MYNVCINLRFESGKDVRFYMYNDMYSSHLFVDLNILRDNARSIMADLGPEVEMMPVLKDDAYGLGLLPVARALASLPGIRTFALAQVSECARLREAGIRQDLLIIGGIPGAHVTHAVACSAVLTVGRLGLVPQIAQEARNQGKTARVHIKIETGLNRIGLKPGEELAALIAELKAEADAVQVDGAFSHFSDIKCLGLDDSSKKQLALFREGLQQLEAAADPQDGHVAGHQDVQQAQLQLVAHAVGLAAFRLRLLAVVAGLHVHAAGEAGKNEASAEIPCLALPQILFRAFDEAFVLPQFHLCYQKINVIKEVI